MALSSLPTLCFDKVKHVSPNRENWTIKVYIPRIWYVAHESDPKDFISLEMLAIDSYGGKIQLTLYKAVVSFMQVDLCEGRVYILKNFAVVPNIGRYKATRHNFRIVLQRKTCITRVECDMIMSSGLAPLTTAAIRALNSSNEFLIDKVLDFLRSNVNDKPVVVVNLAAVGSEEGDHVIKSFNACTKLDFNQRNSDAAEFRHIIALMCSPMDGRVREIYGPRKYISMKDDFLDLNPPKKIAELKIGDLKGTCVVWAKITALICGESWWCWTCKCGSVVSSLVGIYVCGNCNKKVANVSPRFKLRVQVCDGQDSAQFHLKDSDVRDLIAKNCEDLLDEIQDPTSLELPSIFTTLIGRHGRTGVKFGPLAGVPQYNFVPLVGVSEVDNRCPQPNGVPTVTILHPSVIVPCGEGGSSKRGGTSAGDVSMGENMDQLKDGSMKGKGLA
ncbi:Nucleic acid-binding, OB-fold [Sesbania bispinosa]|nr:Nucleic acid-binding, OB-fold [Sesbania bispinosa]